MRRRLVVIAAGLILTGLALAGTSPALGDATGTQTCTAVDHSTEEVRPGVVLTWDSSFRCTDAPPDATYQISVEVTSSAQSTRSATIEDLVLERTTPRPRGEGPAATAEPVGLPITVAPGDTESFEVHGTYELVTTDEGDKANLHLQASGDADGRFELGLNVHLRG